MFSGVKVFHAPFDDSESLTTGELFHVNRATGYVAEALKKNERVLVTCFAGKNRSGLVCGKALVALNQDPVKVVHLIQSKRPNALHNEFFVDQIYSS